MALPDPECGRVISYFYLWRHEREDGRTEGVKARPCVVVLARAQNDGTRRITVAPITHCAATRGFTATLTGTELRA
jgi:mRNA-degrading endonuclease toxin of MazEF toxin-antitoxin module